MIGDRNERPAVASEEMKLLLLSFVALRAQRGKKWCRKSGVGEFRRFLGNPPPDNVMPLSDAKNPAASDANRNLKKLFASHCRECGRCLFGRS